LLQVDDLVELNVKLRCQKVNFVCYKALEDVGCLRINLKYILFENIRLGEERRSVKGDNE
jgi:hypothetical protein